MLKGWQYPVCASFTGLLISGFVLNAQQNWQLAKTEEGVQVFTRTVENSSVEASTAIVTINEPIEKVHQQLMDFDSYCSWMPACIQNRIVGHPSENVYYTYHITKTPWPVQSRDNVSRITIRQLSGGVIKYELENAADYIRKDDDYVRVPRFKGHWLLKPISKTNTRVEFYTHTDPGGLVPKWLVNWAVAENPLNTLKALREHLEGQ